jgi:leucyl aminopeptidase
MQFDVWSKGLPTLEVDALVLGVFDDGELADEARAADSASGGRLKAAAARGDISGRIGDALLLVDVPGLKAGRVVLAGLGARKDLNRKGWKRALDAAVLAVLRTRIASIAIALPRPGAKELDDYYLGRAVAEIVGARLYRINDLKTSKKPKAAALTSVLAGPVRAAGAAAARRGLAHGAAIATAAKLQRDLGNLPPNVCTPSYLADQARAMAKKYASLKVQVLDESGIRKEKMGCFLAVTQGSLEPPRFIVLEHRGGKAGKAPVVLVGKGITFDTGGISLKDPGAMDEMKYDMSGSAAVLSCLNLAAELRLPINVVGLVASCENMPSGNAVKPGDIVTSASGQTVEILNTDAEGRLVLCDALNYARRFKPSAVVDIATLTGACVVALGAHHTGVMANDDALARELVEASVRADDRAWQLPVTEEYADQLRSNFADMANIGGREGGAITAAAFLGKFTKGLSWAHLDIAGTAYVGGKAKGSTGRPVPMLGDFLIRRAGG